MEIQGWEWHKTGNFLYLFSLFTVCPSCAEFRHFFGSRRCFVRGSNTKEGWWLDVEVWKALLCDSGTWTRRKIRWLALMASSSSFDAVCTSGISGRDARCCCYFVNCSLELAVRTILSLNGESFIIRMKTVPMVVKVPASTLADSSTMAFSWTRSILEQLATLLRRWHVVRAHVGLRQGNDSRGTLDKWHFHAVRIQKQLCCFCSLADVDLHGLLVVAFFTGRFMLLDGCDCFLSIIRHKERASPCWYFFSWIFPQTRWKALKKICFTPCPVQLR